MIHQLCLSRSNQGCFGTLFYIHTQFINPTSLAEIKILVFMILVSEIFCNFVGENIIPMNYPLISEYIEAIKAAEDSFKELTNLRSVYDDKGQPLMTKGTFGVVFKMQDKETGNFYALKCFTKEQEGRSEAYHEITEALKDVKSPYLVSFRYLEEEIFVETKQATETRFPVLLMDWVEGKTLDKYIQENINDYFPLRQFANRFRKMSNWLLSQPFAHGDIASDNIIVKEDGQIVLVDYDGMFVQSMDGQKAIEMGDPNFRNPFRTESDFNKGIDTFPIISILLSIELLIENREYLIRFGGKGRLLFSEKDYRDLDKSELFTIAFVSYDDEISDLARHLKINLTSCDTNSDLLSRDVLKSKRHANNIIEIPIRIFCFIYSIVLFVFPFIMRSSGWQLLKISYYMLLANIVVFVFINIADMLRPSKKDHIGIGSPELCLGVIATFVPLLLMTDLFSEMFINENNYLSFLDLPSYQGEWYITFLIWVIWCISFVVYGSLMDEYYSLRVILFRTSKEKAIEQEEKEMERIRSEIREKELQRKRKLEEQKNREDALPF